MFASFTDHVTRVHAPLCVCARREKGSHCGGAKIGERREWNIRKEKGEWRARQSLRGSENTRKENGISERRMEVREAREAVTLRGSEKRRKEIHDRDV